MQRLSGDTCSKSRPEFRCLLRRRPLSRSMTPRSTTRDALVVAISQSGESTDTNAFLQRAREDGVVTVGVTNEAGSTLARLAEHVHAGSCR